MPPDSKFEPDWAMPPGEILAEVLTERHITAEQLAAQTGLSELMVQALLRGDAALSPEIADRLAVALPGISAKFWTNLEDLYRQRLGKGLCGAIIAILVRVESDPAPKFSWVGEKRCVQCAHWCWVHVNVAAAVEARMAIGVCRECALGIVTGHVAAHSIVMPDSGAS